MMNGKNGIHLRWGTIAIVLALITGYTTWKASLITVDRAQQDVLRRLTALERDVCVYSKRGRWNWHDNECEDVQRQQRHALNNEEAK